MTGKWLWRAALVLAGISCLDLGMRVGLAQQARENVTIHSATATAPVSLPRPEFYILAELTQALDAKKLKPGDRIKAEVIQAVVSHGKVLIPDESKLIGHVTEVKAAQKNDPESRLGIIFDKVLLKHSREASLQAIVHTVEPPAVLRSRVDEPSQMLAPFIVPRAGQPMPMGAGTIANRGTGMAGSEIAGNPAGAPESLPPPGSSNVASRPGVPLSSAGNPKSMTVGAPLGVYGLKGLSLVSGSGASTPGPVILSPNGNVRLENGTQILLLVTSFAASQQ